MESSFTGGWYPDLSRYAPIESTEDFIPDTRSGFYAVSFDPKGKLGWKSSHISDDDPGHDKAQIVEVLTAQADKPLFMNPANSTFALKESKQYNNGVVWMNDRSK